MKRLLISAVCLTMAMAHSFADDFLKYKEFMDEVKSEVYARDMPSFVVGEIPDKYKGESAVILAMYQEINAKKKTSFGFNSSIIGLGNNAKIHADMLTRMLVLINDKAALENYSEFDFSVRDKTDYVGFKSEDTRKALGARIIKPDGRVVEVDTDDYIDVLQGKKGQEQRQKLAVPGLEIGDRLDLFVFTSLKLQNMHLPPVAFVLKDDYPILDYRIHCELDDDLTTQYRTLNGAPDFDISVDDKKNYILDLGLKNIDGKNPRLWYNEMQQSPVILFQVFNRRANSYTYTPPSAKKDGMHANPDARLIHEDLWDIGLVDPKFNGDWISFCIKDGKKLKKELFKLHQQKKISDVELTDYIYNLWMYAIVSGNRRYSSRSMVSDLHKTFNQAKLNVGYGITTDEDCEPVDQLISYRDAVWYLDQGNGSRYYFAPIGFFAPDEVPYTIQGRRGVPALTGKERRANPDASVLFPMSDPADNVGTSSLVARINGTRLVITRREDAVGSCKMGSMSVLSEEDIVEGYAAFLNRYGLTVAPKENKKAAADREARYADIRKARIDVAKAEVYSYHKEDPAEVRDLKVLNLGVDPADSVMSYTVDYSMDNMVRRAGPNLVVPVGKLISGQMEILGSDRNRTDDVYMSSPRTYRTEIELEIPAGYRVSDKSLDALSADVDNEAGAFKAVASVDGDKLKISVEKVYKHKIEPASNWPLLVDVLDAAVAWGAKTVLLEK